MFKLIILISIKKFIFEGAAAYTGAVTHSLSIAVIVCETTGQLSPLLPVLVRSIQSNNSIQFIPFQRLL
jgi:H+/Cl- antiporter ClcA